MNMSQTQRKIAKSKEPGVATKLHPRDAAELSDSENLLNDAYIHPTADVSAHARIGAGTRIWHEAQIRERATLGTQCIVGKSVYIDSDVIIGDRVKIQNCASLYRGLIVESGVFIGPHVCFTNDRYPRAITTDDVLKTDADWEIECTHVRFGASIGAGAIILPGVRIGTYAMIGAGAVVTHDVPDQTLVVGNPARVKGYVCRCGKLLQLDRAAVRWYCATCRETYVFGL